ncbi:hypothetical protein CFOL_v3_31577 [Cephalotus follicularis]|uniref:CCHC-type domain-containing protein n=1 Tax=Cephalotus follicularis TaxID=3775 RepID=A0A1Q3D6T7_CEPFO|nr:hypothetical protein CFOL_v3_31577 [Cephalotus follicularis]
MLSLYVRTSLDRQENRSWKVEENRSWTTILHLPPNCRVGNEVDSIALSCHTPGIFIRDPETVKTKGHPKHPSRIPAGIEAPKKRKCKLCGEKGHYATTCQKKTRLALWRNKLDTWFLRR